MLRSAAAPNQETTPTPMQQRQLNQLLSSQPLPRWRNAPPPTARELPAPTVSVPEFARAPEVARPLPPIRARPAPSRPLAVITSTPPRPGNRRAGGGVPAQKP